MIFVLILKIMGIILLCVLGLAVLILLLALFYPIGYSAKARGKDKEIGVNADIFWLFGIVKAKVIYDGGGPGFRISAFGIPIKEGNFKRAKKKKSKKKRPGGEAVLCAEACEKPEEETVSRETVLRMLKQQRLEKSGNIVDKINLKRLKIKSKTAAGRTAKEKKDDFKNKIRQALDKAKDLKDKGTQIKRALDTKTGQKATGFIKIQIIKFFRAIKPDMIKGIVKYGTDDPAGTAKIYGFAAQAAYLITHDRLVIVPDFDNKSLELDVVVKGRIFLCRIAAIAINVLLNREVSVIWKEIRRITNGGQN